MRKLLVAIAAASAIAAGAGGAVQAQPIPLAGPNLIQAQVRFYRWGGRRYCWYNSAWRGPGWYWCGYPWRTGYGWGGPWGWHGWVGGHPPGWYGYGHPGWRFHRGWHRGWRHHRRWAH